MSDLSDIRKSIRTLAGADKQNMQIFTACIKSVDWDNRNCTVTSDDGRDFTHVRLRALLDDKTGICIKPKVDSTVLVGIVEGMEQNTYIAQYTDADEVSIQMQDIDIVIDNTGKVKMKVKNLEIQADETKFNNGSDTIPFTSKIIQRLNAIENAFNTHTHPVSGTATSVPVSPMVNSTAQQIENTKIKH